ncbi:MAG: C-GCAxxG-C-C family protein [Oscillospiraceae bacterium]|nr:C-GCAxxG-C-C family protein [Oscillospiraceae bacterium]MDD3832982.1 C-GCAxxG-C-C family protein [Oscillospiraceae bacterium]MDD4545729.1 C-GCAxxG-C-C family protein [Oscillospiraceae bacterium]
MSKHSQLAKELFDKGYNCAQSVVLAFCDETGLDSKTALKLSSSFGGGMGRLREVCGAVSGMFMVAGMLYGYFDPLDRQAKVEHYKLIQYLGMKFKEENNSIICRELTSIPAEKEGNIKRRTCSELVEQAGEILDEYIQSRKEPTNLN